MLRSFLFFLVVLFTVGCGPRKGNVATVKAKIPRDPALVVVLKADASLPFADMFGAVKTQALYGGYGGDCYLLWGDLAAPPEASKPADLRWGEGEAERIEGWIACGAPATAALKDPRVKNVGIVGWQGGQMIVGNPKSPELAMALDDLEAASEGARQPAVALFDPDSTDPAAPSAQLLARLARLTETYLLAALPLE